MKRKKRVALLSAYLLSGAFLLQLGPCLQMGLAAGAASAPGVFLNDQGQAFGIFNVCGVPNQIAVSPDGLIIGQVLNAGDDLVFGCPINQVVVQNGGGEGG